MSELEKTEQFDNAKVSLIVDLDPLEPIGYIYRDGERFPILLGGRSYKFDGKIIVKNKHRSHIHIQNIKVGVEGKMTTILTKTTANEVLIEDATILKTIDRSISKTISIPFTITSYTPKVDSYTGITTSINHNIIAIVATPGIDIFTLTIPYYIRFPMPISPLSMSLTTTCNLLDMFVIQLHLDRTMFAVNDIITGWVEVLKSERRMESVFVSLIRKETMRVQNDEGVFTEQISKDQLLKQEIVDTVMIVNSFETEKKKKIADVHITAEYCEDWIDTSVSHIPFRLFINEFMGVCPGYSLVNNQLSVSWELKFSVIDQNKLEYTHSVDIDIVRGDIYTL